MDAYRQLRNEGGLGEALKHLGTAHLFSGDASTALELQKQSLEIATRTGNRGLEASALNNLGLAHEQLADPATAERYFSGSLRLARSIGDQRVEAIALSNLGRIYLNRSEFAKARDIFLGSLAIARKRGRQIDEVDYLGELGKLSRNLHQIAQAIEYQSQGLELARRIDYRLGEANALGNLGVVYLTISRIGTAIEHFEEALEIAHETDDEQLEGHALSGLGDAYYYIGEYARALEYRQASLEIGKRFEESTVIRAALSNMALIYSDLEDYDQALRYYRQSLELARADDDHYMEGEILGNLGSVYREQGSYEQATAHYRDSIEIARKYGDRETEANALGNLGLLELRRGRHAASIPLYEQSLAIDREIDNASGVADDLNNLGLAFLSLGEVQKAIDFLTEAVDLLGPLRAGLRDRDRISYFDTQLNSYRLLQLAYAAQGRVEEALETSERGRARALTELMIAEQDSHSAQQPGYLQAAEISRFAREQDLVILEYSVVYSNLFIWVIQPSGEIHFRRQELADIERPLAELVTRTLDATGARGAQVLDPGAAPRPADDSVFDAQLAELHSILIRPVAELLPSKPEKRVAIIPHRDLFLVPFPALRDADGHYLIDRHTVLFAPSIQVLQLTAELRRPRRQGSAGQALVIGNPEMPSAPLDVGEQRVKLRPLPGAEQEALAVAELLGTEPLLGARATKSTVTRRMPEARILHFATHGLLDEAETQRSAIALAPADGDSGLMTAAEVASLKLSADLAVLSACNTGRGRITGDGVVGLSRAFVSAGVPSVVVSLWSVPDSPTAHLMRIFYTRLLASDDKAAALRDAMIATRKSFPSPRDWAAFTLVGQAR